MPNTTEVIEAGARMMQDHGETGLFAPDIAMLIFTWATFLLLLGILYKFAWKPILAGLDQREETIRRSLDEAEKTRQEFEKIDETRQHLMSQAEQEAKDILNNGRKAAHNASRVISERTKEETQIILKNAQREVNAEFENAEEKLRRESAQAAVVLAGKLIEENLDTPKNHRLVEKLITKI